MKSRAAALRPGVRVTDRSQRHTGQHGSCRAPAAASARRVCQGASHDTVPGEVTQLWDNKILDILPATPLRDSILSSLQSRSSSQFAVAIILPGLGICFEFADELILIAQCSSHTKRCARIRANVCVHPVEHFVLRQRTSSQFCRRGRPTLASFRV